MTSAEERISFKSKDFFGSNGFLYTGVADKELKEILRVRMDIE